MYNHIRQWREVAWRISESPAGDFAFDMRARVPYSTPVSPDRLRTTLRCFSKGCLERIFVDKSAGLCSVPTWETVTTPAPRSSRILNILRSMWREFCAEVKRWHKS